MTLRLEGISRHFVQRAVLQDTNLHVAAGEKVALLGANGSGKTTLLRIAAGTLRPTAGQRHAGTFAYVPQDAPVYAELSCAEHLAFSCRLHGTRPDPSTLGALAHVSAGELSRGQRQRLHLVMAMQSGAQLLILDEPFTALDDEQARWLETALADHEGAILMSLHDAELAGRICKRSLHL